MKKRLDRFSKYIDAHFVDRDEVLAWLKEWGTFFPRPLSDSIALVGRRRTGKTAILVQLFAYLFHEQKRVLPVFISFEYFLLRGKPITTLEYIQTFLGGYIASYMAFKYDQPDLLSLAKEWNDLREAVEPQADDLVNELYARYDRGLPGDPYNGLASFVRGVGGYPERYALRHDMPTVVIIDEFQMLTNVYNPVTDRTGSITSTFVPPSESLIAPLLVSGSAVSLLVNEALADGLSGRIGHYFISPLPKQHTHDLVFRLAKSYNLTVTESFADMVWELTGGYPYSIERLMQTRSPARQQYPDLDALEDAVQFELTNIHGYLRQHYAFEFAKFTHELNEGDTTRKVMFWTTKYPDKRIDFKQIAQEKTVRASLEKLQWVDIVKRTGLISYEGPSDPMLCRYIEYQHKIEIENLSPEEALKDWHQEYLSLMGRVNHFVGHVAEGYVYAILSGFDGRLVKGMPYFSVDQDVILPAFTKIERRSGTVQKGKIFEMDLIAEYPVLDDQKNNVGTGVWFVQVKYWKEPVGEKAIEEFINSTQIIAQEKGYTKITRWFFCKQGYRSAAEKRLQQEGILYSNLEQFNAFANLFKFFGLPEE